MSETLWAAVIGGVIGGIIAIAATIPPLIYRHYHWKKEKKLEHLHAERRRLEELNLNILSDLHIGIRTSSHLTAMKARIGLTLPYDVSIKIYAILDKEWDDDINWEEVVPYEIGNVMREPLDEIDKKIKELMS